MASEDWWTATARRFGYEVLWVSDNQKWVIFDTSSNIRAYTDPGQPKSPVAKVSAFDGSKQFNAVILVDGTVQWGPTSGIPQYVRDRMSSLIHELGRGRGGASRSSRGNAVAKDHDANGRPYCPGCGTVLDDPGDDWRYVAGDPGMSEGTAVCPGCGMRYRWKSPIPFVRLEPGKRRGRYTTSAIEWVSSDGMWASMGVSPVETGLDGEPAAGAIQFCWPDYPFTDEAEVAFIMADGSLEWGPEVFDVPSDVAGYVDGVRRRLLTASRSRKAAKGAAKGKGRKR